MHGWELTIAPLFAKLKMIMLSSFKPISRQQIGDTVVQELLQQFVNGNLRLGHKLPSEAELAEQLGAGRNSVREAMKVLQVLGLVERRQGDGSYISSGGSNTFEVMLFALVARIHKPVEMVELRKVFELGVAELLLPRLTDAQMDELEQAAERFAAFREHDPFPADEALKADVNFHIKLVELANNQALTAIGHVIMRLVSDSIREHHRDDHGVDEAINDHRATVEALRARDLLAVVKAINDSFDRWQKYVRL